MTATEDISVLINAVQDLNVSVNETTTSMHDLARKAELTARKAWWNRVIILLTVFGLFLDIGITVVLVEYQVQQQCLSDLRAQSAEVASADRKNQNDLILDILLGGKIKTHEDLVARAESFKKVVDQNNVKRERIGVADSSKCPLFG